MKNFPFTHEGQEYWYSRSVAAGVVLITTDENNDKYLLTIKRGSAVEHPHKWSVPCGYLDFDETIQDCAFRELYEEAGLDLQSLYDKKQYEEIMKFLSATCIDNPNTSSKQNITFLYKLWIPNGLSLPITSINCDPNEIDEVKWLKLTEYNSVDWAFNDIFKKQVREWLQV